jgi:hypothetical protein
MGCGYDEGETLAFAWDKGWRGKWNAFRETTAAILKGDSYWNISILRKHILSVFWNKWFFHNKTLLVKNISCGQIKL